MPILNFRRALSRFPLIMLDEKNLQKIYFNSLQPLAETNRGKYSPHTLHFVTTVPQQRLGVRSQ
jgi:hypothetical protein